MSEPRTFGPGESAVAQKQSAIMQHLDALKRVASDLGETVSILEDRLKPILQLPGTCAKECEKAPPSSGSPMCQTIQDAVAFVRNSQKRIDDMVNNLEV